MNPESERRFLISFVRELKAELDLEREVRMELERRLKQPQPPTAARAASLMDRSGGAALLSSSGPAASQPQMSYIGHNLYLPSNKHDTSITSLSFVSAALPNQDASAVIASLNTSSHNNSAESDASYFSLRGRHQRTTTSKEGPSRHPNALRVASTHLESSEEHIIDEMPAPHHHVAGLSRPKSSSYSSNVGSVSHGAALRSLLSELEVHARWQLHRYEADCFDALCAMFVQAQEHHDQQLRYQQQPPLRSRTQGMSSQGAWSTTTTTNNNNNNNNRTKRNYREDGKLRTLLTSSTQRKKEEDETKKVANDIDDDTPRKQLAFASSANTTLRMGSPDDNDDMDDSKVSAREFERYRTLIDALIHREAKARQERDDALRELQTERRKRMKNLPLQQQQQRSSSPPSQRVSPPSTAFPEKDAASPSLFSTPPPPAPMHPTSTTEGGRRSSAFRTVLAGHGEDVPYVFAQSGSHNSERKRAGGGRSPESQRLLEEVLALTEEAISRDRAARQAA